MDLRETKQIIYHSKGIDESYPKMYFLLNLNHYVKSDGHLCQILAFYDAHSLNMAMSRDPRSKFRKNLFLPNSAFNIRKSYKICSRKALYFRSYQPKTSRGGGGGWKTPPQVLLGLKEPSKFSSFWPKNVRFDRKQFGKLYKKWKLHLHLKRPS